MTTLLVIDIGNTNVSLGLFDHTRTAPGKASSRITGASAPTGSRPPTRWPSPSRASSPTSGGASEEVDDVIISSVVPPLLPIFERVSTKLFDRPPLVVGTRRSAPACRSATRTRARSGPTGSSTRIAAFEMFGGPVIAVDFGTATTFDCVSGEAASTWAA